MTTRFAVFQHLPWEGPGTFLIQSAQKQGVELCVVEAWHQPLPDLRTYDGLIVLGGTPNVDQEREYPFLRAEKKAIRAALQKDMPCMGFCLGHQLLANALGARVGLNFCRSIGFTEGLLTRAGMEHPIFSGLPSNFPLFKWHSRAVLPPLPKAIQILVTSPQCQVEAVSVEGRPHVIGFQFDNHAACMSEIRTWVDSDRAWLAEPPQVDPAAILRGAQSHEVLVGEQFDVLFENYIKLVTS